MKNEVLMSSPPGPLSAGLPVGHPPVGASAHACPVMNGQLPGPTARGKRGPSVSERRRFVLGTRTSKLALAQTEIVRTLLAERFPHIDFEVCAMKTQGDVNQSQPLYVIGGKSLWTKELEVAMLDGRVDAIVHSLKDVPTEFPPGCCLGATVAREDPRDVLVVKRGATFRSLADLPAGSVVGTSSVRRVAQLRRLYPELQFADMRGNIHTRCRKLDDPASPYAGIVLAAAGLIRCGLDTADRTVIPLDALYYAVGQGSIAVEVREDDADAARIVAAASCADTWARVTAERAMLHALEGGCSVPVGCRSSVAGGILTLTGTVTSLTGLKSVITTKTTVLPHGDSAGATDAAAALGSLVAQTLIDDGAREILEELGKHVAEVKQPAAPTTDEQLVHNYSGATRTVFTAQGDKCLRPQGW